MCIECITHHQQVIQVQEYFIQGEFQSKQDFFNLAPSSGAMYMSTSALESAIVYRLPVKIS